MARRLDQLIGPDARVPEGLRHLLITGITADSRAVEPGFLFAALPGTKKGRLPTWV